MSDPPLLHAGGETLLTHKKKATRAKEEAGRSRCAEIFSPLSKGESFSSSFSCLSGLVNSSEGGKRGEKRQRGVNQTLGTLSQ